MANPFFQYQLPKQGGAVFSSSNVNSLLPLAALLQSMTKTNGSITTEKISKSNASQVSPLTLGQETTVTDYQSEAKSDYKDYSNVPAEEGDKIGLKRSIVESDARGSNFPTKLHDMLSRAEFSDVIAWSHHGRSWRVLKPKAFEQQVLPKYFRHGKYNSFMRQVNGWGFRRISQGPDYNSYYHEFFLRGMSHLCRRMRRASVSRGNGEVAYDPDFRKMRPLPINNMADQDANRVSDSDSSSVESYVTGQNALYASQYNVSGTGLAPQISGSSTLNNNGVQPNLLLALSQMQATFPVQQHPAPQALSDLGAIFGMMQQHQAPHPQGNGIMCQGQMMKSLVPAPQNSQLLLQTILATLSQNMQQGNTSQSL